MSTSSSSSSYNAAAIHRVDKGSVIAELKTLNQWDAMFKPDIRTFQTPKAICGFTSIVNALLLAEHLPDHTVTPEQINTTLRILRDPTVVLPRVRRVMEWVSSQRSDYIRDHPADFPTSAARQHYMQDWVANYEISQFLHQHVLSSPLRSRVHFLRHIERSPDIKHEELRRLGEEKPFDHLRYFVDSLHGTIPAKSEAESLAAADAAPLPARDADMMPGRRAGLCHGSSMGSHGCLRSPGRWVAEFGPVECEKRHPVASPVFVADMAGHFVVMKPVWVQEGGDDDDDDDDDDGGVCSVTPTLLIFNSGKSVYHESEDAYTALSMMLRGESELTVEAACFLYKTRK